ncbi:amidase family protein [Streptomyces sp. NPDC008343]|uniref:amidase family protein n=1 Tax=Streptomyces sp. NPDC008343 TaxID=3364828 RepID=UPI0036E818AC
MIDVAMQMAPGFQAPYDRVGQWWEETHTGAPPVADWTPGNDEWNATQYLVNLPGQGVGPLSGVTLAVKDSIRIAGVPLAYGSRLVAGHSADSSATVVHRALTAGAVITHTGRADNLGLAITGDQSYAGPVLNPWNPGHTTWGSSAGAAALVAADVVQAAILVDQAGSGRAPAAGCGLAALMPTRGLLPMTGILGLTTVQDRVVVASRRTATVAQLASVISGSDGYDLKCGPEAPPRDWTAVSGDVRGLRIGLVTESLDHRMCDPVVADRVRDRAEKLEAIGATVREVSVPHYADAAALALVLTVQQGIPDLLTGGLGGDTSVLTGDPALAHRFSRLRRPDRTSESSDRCAEWLAPTVQLCAAAASHDGGQAPGVWIAASMGLIPRLTEAFTGHFSGVAAVDVLMTPTVPSPPPAIPDDDMSTFDLLSRAMSPGILHTCAHNLTGLPAGNCPAGLVDGLPVGIQVVAPALREDQVVRVLSALEPEGGFPAAR